jgi:hypothetical protein
LDEIRNPPSDRDEEIARLEARLVELRDASSLQP